MTATMNAPMITNRLQEMHGRGRVTEAIHALALDLVDPYARDHLCADDFGCLSELVEEPVVAATNAALDVLVSELEDALVRADPRLVERLEWLRRQAAFGID